MEANVEHKVLDVGLNSLIIDGVSTVCLNQVIEVFVDAVVVDLIEGNSVLSSGGETSECILVLKGKY